MSLEQNIAELNTNIKALVAALAAGGSVSAASTGAAAASTDTAAASTGKPAGGKKGAAKAEAKGPSREEMVAALTEVKEKFGAAEAKAIISKVGATKMAEIADDKIGTAFTLAKAKLEVAEEETVEDDGL